MPIKQFTISHNDASLTIYFTNGESACLGFEYLRVFSPPITNAAKPQALVTHKKRVQLITIEPVGKHGYRLVFDDQHSAIYCTEYLLQLIQEEQQRWQDYLTELQASGHSREAMIDITQL